MVDLCTKLAGLLALNLTSIEILPSTFAVAPPEDHNPHAPFCLTEGNLGVPQKALYQAYAAACRSLGSKVESLTVEMDLRATSVILLANPGNSTALNRRRTFVLYGYQDAHRELSLSERLLTVQQVAKASLLWCYRRWLLQRIFPLHAVSVDGVDDSIDSDTICAYPIPLKNIDREFSISSRACEIYPRNYYAWRHRYLVMRCLVSQALKSPIQPALSNALITERGRALHWISLHIADHSAVHYLCQLDKSVGELDLGAHAAESLSNKLHADPTRLIDHAAELVQSYPTHESLWIFLRESFILATLQDDRYVWDAGSFLSGLHTPSEEVRNVRPGTRQHPESDVQRSQAFASRFRDWLALWRASH